MCCCNYYLPFVHLWCENGGLPTIRVPIVSGLSTNKQCDATVAKAVYAIVWLHIVWSFNRKSFLSHESLLNPKRILSLYTIVDKETWLSDSTRQDNPLTLSPWKEYSHTLHKESIRCETSSWQFRWFYVENGLHCDQYNITTLVTSCFKCQCQDIIVNHTMKYFHQENRSPQSTSPDLKKEDFLYLNIM